MLIISSIKEVPTTKAGSISRAIYLMPGMFCAAILAGSGVNIDMENTTVSTNSTITETIFNATTNAKITNATTATNNTTTETNVITLQNPVWILVHFMIFAVLGVYVVNQVLMLLTKLD